MDHSARALALLRRVWEAQQTSRPPFASFSAQDQALLRVLSKEAPPLVKFDPHWAVFVTGAGIDALSRSEELADQVSRQQAQQDAEKAAQDEQAVVDRKKQFRHDFKVAAFSVLLALFIEHLPDIVNFLKRLLEPLFQVGK